MCNLRMVCYLKVHSSFLQGNCTVFHFHILWHFGVNDIDWQVRVG